MNYYKVFIFFLDECDTDNNLVKYSSPNKCNKMLTIFTSHFLERKLENT